MTRREVFLQADPQAIHDMIGFVEVDLGRSVERFRSERPFYICKGLKWFAEGIKYDVPKETVLSQIAETNCKFKFTELQLNSVYQGRQATLCSAIEALGLSNELMVDERINQWLDQTVMSKDGEDVNAVASNIISDLIKKMS